MVTGGGILAWETFDSCGRATVGGSWAMPVLPHPLPPITTPFARCRHIQSIQEVFNLLAIRVTLCLGRKLC